LSRPRRVAAPESRGSAVKVLAVVPVRYEASRFPGKPLADLNGRPLVQWVYEAAASCTVYDDVIVATDNDEIAARVRDFGGHVELTRDDHPTGTDRVAEVAERHADADVIVNVQGDQPFVVPQMLHALVEPYLAGERPAMTTLACPIVETASWTNPNVVKVVRGVDGYALYFSRSPIPHGAMDAGANVKPLHHLGLYAFARETVLRLRTLPPTPLEQQERLEQLRALEHGIDIRVCETDRPLVEVNTPEDLDQARRLVLEGTTG
jgi:3-deoxy-manno-octulosonate cytidylyltransferase (CMP-KDO synthetase)